MCFFKKKKSLIFTFIEKNNYWVAVAQEVEQAVHQSEVYSWMPIWSIKPHKVPHRG